MTKIDDIIIGSEVSTDVHKDYGNSGILVAIMHYSNLDYALIQYKKMLVKEVEFKIHHIKY